MPLVTNLFEHQAEVYPAKIALTFKGGQYTYQYLNETSNQVAAFLRHQGVQINDIVGIAVNRSPKMLICIMGILKVGAGYVPLDPEYPRHRIEFMLKDSKAKTLITETQYKGFYKTDIREILVEDLWEAISDYSVTNVKTTLGGHNLAYVIYTSGSTGVPKGVQVEHHSLYNLLISVQKFPGLIAADRLLAISTISFDISVLEMFLPLISGAQLVLIDAITAKDGSALLDIIKKENITFIQATPFTFKIMIEAGWNEKINLKVICGGEALSRGLAKKLTDRCRAVYNMYGPTETTIYSIGKLIKATDTLITIGWPIANTRVYILDEHLTEVENGETGEICISGEGVARGYLNRPELTKEKFLNNRISPEDGKILYRTGDLGRVLPSGEIECFGRIDNQVKIKGYRIELAEIEHVLANQKDVKEAVVISPKSEYGITKLVAYVVTDFKDIQSEETKRAIQNWKITLTHQLPSFMLPNDIVVLRNFPLTDNGKIDRHALAAIGLPNSNTSVYAAATNNLEQLMVDIWREYLNVGHVGINDTFFELGGDSLVAARVITRIERETGKRVRLADLLAYDTVKQLAEFLQRGTKRTIIDALVPIKPEGNKVPLYIVHGNGSTAFRFISFAQQLDSEQPVYGLQAIGIDGFKEPFDNVADIAAAYVEEVLAQNPDGPYALSGYSFGGVIAVEMAHQLTAKGKTVSMLAMLEGYVLENHQLESGFYKSVHKAYARILQFLFGFYLLGKQPQRAIGYQIDSFCKGVNKIVGKRILLEKQTEDSLKYIYKVAAVHSVAVANYKIVPYDGEIYVFKAQERSFYIDDFNYLGWKPYAKTVKVFNIEGEHSSIFDPPYNKKFAQQLQQCLDICNQKYNAPVLTLNTSQNVVNDRQRIGLA